MDIKTIRTSVLAVMSVAMGAIVPKAVFAAERPELTAYPYKTSVTAGGTYANGSAAGTDFVVSGTITSALTFSSDVPYRVTLDGATVSAPVTLGGNATLWLKGTSAITTSKAAALTSTGTLTVGGTGSATLTSSPTKKATGVVNAVDMTVAGGALSVVLDSQVKNACGIALTTDIDKSTACGLRTSESNSVFSITGGTLNLVASGKGGKCLVAKGELVVGTSGQTTTPSDSTFYPDIQAATYGEQIYVAAKKQKNYLSVGTATTATDISSCYYASNCIVSASGENVDYSNPKCIKAEGNLTMHGGRIRGFSQAEGGEGFESKKVMTINGGVFEATTYDDCINASESLVINGGYLYCGATNNDCIDSNGTGSDSIVINGGIVLCFTAAMPEIGIDTDNSSGLKINGGTVVSFGSAAGNMVVGSTGSLATYKGTSVSASTYAGKYLKMTGGSKTVYVKVPSMSSGSGSLSLVCTTDGCTSAPSVSAASSASGTSRNFHGVY